MRQKAALREGDVRIPSGCAIAGIMDRSGARHDGSDILKSIALMHDRSNGLGGGFAETECGKRGEARVGRGGLRQSM